MMDEYVKFRPEAGELPRQNEDSYILVDPEVELELRHFKALLVLNSMGDMDLSIGQNSQAVLKALERAVDILSMAVRGWHWIDRHGQVLDPPDGKPDAFDALGMAEVTWMLGEVSGALRAEAVPQGS